MRHLTGSHPRSPQEGRHFQAVLEDAMRERPPAYIESNAQESKVRPEVMAHFQASVEKNRRLGELLAKRSDPWLPHTPGSPGYA